MKRKVQLKGQLRRYVQWPLILSALLLVMNLAMYFVSVKAGCLMSGFLIIYIAVVLLLYVKNRPQIYGELVSFATQYGQVQRKLLKELAIPYALLDEDGEMRILGIEATLALRMNIYEEEEAEILSDMYSLEQQCIFDTKETVLEELLMQNQSKCKVTERLSLPELKEDVLQILHSQGSIQLESEQHTSEGIRVEGILHLSFLYLRGDDAEPYGNWQGMIPFSWLIEYPDMPEQVNSSLSYHVEKLAVTLAGSEAVEVKAILSFEVFLRRLVPVEVITEVRTEPLDMKELSERPGIVGHIVQNGEDLWSLAKKYMTTIDGIREINGLNDEKVSQGDKLLIFKENVSIL